MVQLGDGGELDPGLPRRQPPRRAEQPDQRVVAQPGQAVVEGVAGQAGQRPARCQLLHRPALGERRAPVRRQRGQPPITVVTVVVVGVGLVQAVQLGVGRDVPAGQQLRVQALHVRVEPGQHISWVSSRPGHDGLGTVRDGTGIGIDDGRVGTGRDGTGIGDWHAVTGTARGGSRLGGRAGAFGRLAVGREGHRRLRRCCTVANLLSITLPTPSDN